MMSRTTLMLMALILCAVPAAAGTIAPGLEFLLRDQAPDDPLKVLVVLRQQADIPALDRDLRATRTARPDRHRLVVNSLRESAAQSQTELLAELAAKSVSGQVVGHVSHWLVNAVVVTATPAAIREIAARDDVARVEPDLVVSLIAPLPGLRQLPEFVAGGGAGLTPNIQATGAPRVWNELGIDGTGTIVGIMDTGVDGHHPALAARWRGNFAPPEECWIDASGLGDTSFPVDRDVVGHGTHVMGILTGQAPADTIGVAPGARWIAANTVGGGLGPLDNAMLASLEFMADPDGDPATSDDVPDVVQNSWGVMEAMQGYFDCDSRWWDAIDNCEAAGVVLVWSAGNEGHHPGTLRSPADRASSPYNCFSVGSAATAPPFLVSYFSSRGPSGCGGAFATKPEIVAPGEDIYSARADGGFRVLSGTSMSGPHIAGVVALMRQANPDVDVTTIKEILVSTALDLGDPGQDNHYGHGFVDAYAAVIAVMTETGTLTGHVTDLVTGLPLAGVRITRTDGFNTARTDSGGDFSLTMLAGPAHFAVSGFGYFEGEFAVTILPGGMTHHELSLAPEPVAVIGGQVFGPDGQPVSAATVRVIDEPVYPVTTDLSGTYALTLPVAPGRIYDLEASAPDLGYDYHSVEPASDLTLDFHLPEQVIEDFESANFYSFPWMGGGDAAWAIDSVTRYEGNYSARSGSIGNDQRSALSLDYFVRVDSYLQFQSKVSSEYFYDNLVFYLDGEVMEFWSGERDWSPYRQLIPRGHHTFTWIYQRDEAYAEGQDTAWLDFIEFPTTGEEQFPSISLDVAAISAAVAEGDTVSAPFILSNTGDWTLDFSIAVGDLLKHSSGPGPIIMATVVPDQGQVAPGASVAAVVYFDAGDLAPDTHVAVMTISSTDPVRPELLVPLLLHVSSTSAAPGADLPRLVVFSGAVPNPFNPSTDLQFSLPADARVELDVFDVSGRKVRALLVADLSAGLHGVPWNGRDDAGRNLASGAYYARLTVDGVTTVKSVSLVR